MKKAFTLIEMLIVVAILAVLMSIVFRLGSVGSEDSCRSVTVVRLQKIENCLSGYYAAFGSYPPVKVHGSRDIYLKVDEETGDQDRDDREYNFEKEEFYSQVDAACRSQPFGCEYPGNDDENELIKGWAQEVLARKEESSTYPGYANASEEFNQLATEPGPKPSDFSRHWNSTDWNEIKLFKFGVMSFLLPRYLFMMGGCGDFYGVEKDDGTPYSSGGGNGCAQWEGNNDLPCDPFSGTAYSSWQKVWNHIEDYEKEGNRDDLAYIVNIPSQAVCARWMPNLEGICTTLRPSVTFFGVNITGHYGLPLGEDSPPPPGTHESDNSSHYRNATITIYDGWGREFYYYSPAPHQSYTLWSAGSNRKTFPPWVSLESLDDSGDRKTAQDWKHDDVIQMSN